MNDGERDEISGGEKVIAELEKYTTELEKIMMHLPGDVSENERKFYLAGVIDTWEQKKIISEKTREELYLSYCF